MAANDLQVPVVFAVVFSGLEANELEQRGKLMLRCSRRVEHVREASRCEDLDVVVAVLGLRIFLGQADCADRRMGENDSGNIELLSSV